MSNQELLERAFALAESGSVQSLYELRTMLAKEGYTHAENAQIHGTLAKQLSAKISAANRKS